MWVVTWACIWGGKFSCDRTKVSREYVIKLYNTLSPVFIKLEIKVGREGERLNGRKEGKMD